MSFIPTIGGSQALFSPWQKPFSTPTTQADTQILSLLMQVLSMVLQNNTGTAGNSNFSAIPTFQFSPTVGTNTQNWNAPLLRHQRVWARQHTSQNNTNTSPATTTNGTNINTGTSNGSGDIDAVSKKYQALFTQMDNLSGPNPKDLPSIQTRTANFINAIFPDAKVHYSSNWKVGYFTNKDGKTLSSKQANAGSFLKNLGESFTTDDLQNVKSVFPDLKLSTTNLNSMMSKSSIWANAALLVALKDIAKAKQQDPNNTSLDGRATKIVSLLNNYLTQNPDKVF